MGATQSAFLKQLEQEVDEEEDEEEEEEQQEEEEDGEELKERVVDREEDNTEMEREEKKLNVEEDELEQDPELLPVASSASPLSPQVSLATTPHLGPAVRVWDPGHVLSPSASHALSRHGRIPPAAFVGDEIFTEVYLIRHGETDANTLPELLGGRTPSAMLTAEGKRQARALGVFLLSQGLHFNAVVSSPLERCKQTAISVCQEANFPQENIEFADALVELSQGLWEGFRRSEIYTPELLNMMASSQPDFRAPGGESQRQVEFRMVEFLNNVVLPKAVEANLRKHAGVDDEKEPSKSNALMQVHPLDEATEERAARMAMSVANRYGKSRLHITSNGSSSFVAGRSASSIERKAAPKRIPAYHAAVFSHAMAIKCLLRGLLGWSEARLTHRLCIDNTSMTVLRHSTHRGWQIQRVNDTAHLRLL